MDIIKIKIVLHQQLANFVLLGTSMLVQQQAAHNVQQAHTRIKVQQLMLIVKAVVMENIKIKWDKAAAYKTCVHVVMLKDHLQQVLTATLMVLIFVRVAQQVKLSFSLAVVRNVQQVKQLLDSI
jgi:hypothetical protein